MILSKKPLTIADVSEYVKKEEIKEEVSEYLKKFSKVSKEKSDEMREAIKKLNNPKIKEEHIVRAVDFLPKDQEDVNKVFLDCNLNEEEARAILEIIKGN